MSINLATSPESKSLKRRPYQSQAISTLLDSVQRMILGQLGKDQGKVYQNALLLEMATGSGKTFTIGKFLELVIKLRNRGTKRNQNSIDAEKYQGLNILVLTNRIDGINQFRDDLVHGRPSEGKAPIISAEILESTRVSTFHSRADSLEEQNHGSGSESDETEVEVFSGGDSEMKDNLFFSTDRTASLKEIENIIPYFDIIIIDEAHNLKKGNDFESLLDRLANHGRKGQAPLIIPITATPTNITKELFGEPAFSYPLAEYLASEYSPSVEYKVVTKTSATLDEVASIVRMIESAKQSHDYQDRRSLLRDIEEKFDEIMLMIPTLEELVADLLFTRISNNQGQIDETIIFVGSIEEANNLTQSINKQSGKNLAVPYHSQTDRRGLDRLKDPNDTTKIVVAVDMLNESIDLPVVSNIVFWRGTDTARIYLQQFGRGLRGKGLVRYYDYVGSMKNFAWIGGIHESYNAIVSRDRGEALGEKNGDSTLSDIMIHSSGNGEKFKIFRGDIGAAEHSIDLTQLGFDIVGLRESIVDAEGIKKELKRLYEGGQLTKGDMTIRNWPSFAARYNIEESNQAVSMPRSLRTITGILGGDWNLSQSGEYIIALLEGRDFSALPVSTKGELETILGALDDSKVTSAYNWKAYAEEFNKNQSQGRGFVLPISLHGVLKVLGADISLPKSMKIVRALVRGEQVQKKLSEYTCAPGEKIKIYGIEYTGVSGPSRIKTDNGAVLSGVVIIKNAKKEKIMIITGRQSSGSVIQLIPTSFIEKLGQTYEEGKIYDYEGGKYIAFNFSGNPIPGTNISGETVKRLAKKSGMGIILGLRNSKGTSINLIKIEDFNKVKNELYKPKKRRST